MFSKKKLTKIITVHKKSRCPDPPTTLDVYKKMLNKVTCTNDHKNSRRINKMENSLSPSMIGASFMVAKVEIGSCVFEIAV